jgi:hypothetical protein
VASTSTDIVSSTSKFKLGEKVSQSSSVYGFVTDVNPTFNRITLNSVEGVFTANSTATGTNKSFVIESVVNERDAVNHYVSQNYPNDVELKTTMFNAVPGAILEVELDTGVATNFTNVNVGTYLVYPTSGKLPLSDRTGVGLSFTLSLDDHGNKVMTDITIAVPSSGYSYSESLIVTKNMVGGQNSTAADLGSTTLAKFTINQVGNAVITNERHELELNEDRHLIRYIQPQYIERVTREFVELVRS